MGLIENIAHPGGNITGFTNMEPTMGGKWLEMLIEVAPRLTRIAVMRNPKTTPTAAAFVTPAESAARKFGQTDHRAGRALSAASGLPVPGFRR
jgi:putative ABC transport system substrate-binding protein